MKGLSLKDIIEYIVSAVIIIIYTLLILFFYGIYETESYSLQSYEIFTEALLVDRLNYCLYQYTGNPYYLFYSPTNSTLYEYWDNLSNCYMNLSGYFEIPVENYSNADCSSAGIKINNNIVSCEAIEYANISYKSVPYFIFYNLNDLTKSYVFFKNVTFLFEYPIGYRILPHAVENSLITKYVTPPMQININSNLNLYNTLSEYIYQSSSYLNDLLYNITTENNTFQDLYSDCFSENYRYGYFIFPVYTGSVFEANYNGEPIVIGLYNFGRATSELYNLTCGVTNEGIINISTCKT
ncbi:MAG: hypothetical protein ACP5GJ_00715 [Nanopusillaceae archaeon]|jgi:hypothetical protein